MEHFIARYSWFNQNDKKELLNPDLLTNGYFDSQSIEHLSKIFGKFKENDYFRAMYYIQGKVHLPNLLTRLDRMTMAHSIEARVPFLDVNLVEFASTLPLHYKLRWNSIFHKALGIFYHSNKISERFDTPKYILKRLNEGRLPREIIHRKKMGFPVPLDSWLNEKKFRNVAREVLLDPNSRIRDFVNIDNLERSLKKESIDSYYDYEGKRIWMLINIELWHRQYFSSQNGAA